MEKVIHIKTSRKIYYGTIVLSTLFVSYEIIVNKHSLIEIISGTTGIIATAITLYSLYKIFFGRGKIMLTESQFKLQGHGWTNWENLVSVYPFLEQDMENGEGHFINFMLKDGTDISVRSEYLEMNFEEIANLVNQYRINHIQD